MGVHPPSNQGKNEENEAEHLGKSTLAFCLGVRFIPPFLAPFSVNWILFLNTTTQTHLYKILADYRGCIIKIEFY